MVKHLIMLTGLIAATFAGNFSGQDISMQILAPEKTESGSTIEVLIEFYKSEEEGFARFHQKLPEGVTATPVYPLEANFSFQNNTVSVIWLRLPDEKQFSLRYKLHIDERLKGELELGGTLSYIHENRRQSAIAPETLVSVTPAPWVDEKEIVDFSEAHLLAPSYRISEEDSHSIAVRQTPVPDGEDFIVNLLVYKAHPADGFARIEELVPEGYRAEEIESSGGLFSFSRKKVEIHWNTLPAEDFLTVSYRLIPEEEITGTPEISGYFSFMEEGTPRTTEIPERRDEIRKLSAEDKFSLIAGLLPAVKEHLPGTTPEIITVEEPPHKELPELTPAASALPNPLQKEPGIYYRVQIAAGRRDIVDINEYFRRRNIRREVATEIHEGWVKYSIGSYYIYRDARDSRNIIWETSPIDDAFVAAYNEGVRITVQEALMVTSQKWYK